MDNVLEIVKDLKADLKTNKSSSTDFSLSFLFQIL